MFVSVHLICKCIHVSENNSHTSKLATSFALLSIFIEKAQYKFYSIYPSQKN